MSHYDNRTVPDGWYDRLIARFYDPFTNYFERGFMGRRRRELLAGLQGSILEVGAGTGANFDHYPPGASVLAIEPSAAMLQRAAEKRAALTAKHADIRLLHAGIGDPEVSRYVPESGFDAIVLTLVLCTIPDPGPPSPPCTNGCAPAAACMSWNTSSTRRSQAGPCSSAPTRFGHR